MLQSEANIANMALGRLGIRNWVGDMDDDTPEAQTASVFYDSSRDIVLRTYNWPFARRRAFLALLPITRDGWGGCYALPGDCLAPRMIWGGTRNPSSSLVIPWTVENNGSTSMLLTDQENPLLIYTAQISTVGLYPPAFAEAVAAKLALDMAFPITGRMEVRVEMLREFREAISAAITEASETEEPDTPPDSEFITGR